MEFNNSCLYANDSSSYQDGHNIKQILESIESNKKHTNLRFWNDFFTTCLFLINKSDLIPNTNNWEDIKNYMSQRLKQKFRKNNINVNFSFFSGKYFFDYLNNLIIIKYKYI